MTSVLLIDDDAALAELLGEYLSHEGFQVSHLADARRCLEVIEEVRADIVVLDIMMPGISGIEALRRIRRVSNKPVLMLSARGDEVDRITGLDLGADDYLAKPCSPGELAARLRAILRRSEGAAGPRAAKDRMMEFGPLSLDSGNRQMRWNGAEVELTGAEFGLMEVLTAHIGQIVSRQDLSERGLGRPFAPYDRAIDVHISAIRQKLAACAQGKSLILSVRGQGYQLVAP